MRSNTRLRGAFAALLSTIILAGAACGGGGTALLAPDLADTRAWPEHGWSGAATSGDYAVVAVDATERSIDPLTENLELRVTADTGVVEIAATAMAPADHAYLHLRYDAAAVHPVATSVAPELAERTVFLGITSKPGVVVLGLAARGGGEVLGGATPLATVEFAPGAVSASRGISAVSATTVDDLRFNFDTPYRLEWSYACKGDYNQDSEVGVADLTPIGIHYLKTSESADWQAAQVADGNEDLHVTVNDLTPIGQNYLTGVTEYLVQGGASATGPFAGTDSVAQSTGALPAAGGYKRYSYDLAAPVEGAWYVVRAVQFGSEASGYSNAAQYSATPSYNPPRNLSAVRDGDHVQLNWDAPSGTIPDSYTAYIGSTPSMDTAIKMHADVITGTTYNVPTLFDPDADHYFGVRAVYGSELSAYSNITLYQAGGSDAPSGLTAVRSGDHLDLSWTAPSGQLPDGYNAYRASDAGMSDALMISSSLITGTTWSAPALISPDSAHYLAVTALYGTVESAYSNVYYFDPDAETDPPTWTGGGTGIKAVTPGTAQVLVEWYEATDAESPPVTYLVYWDEAGDFDWGTANVETVNAPALTTTVGGLVNNTDYMFGVRCRDSLGNQDANTETLIATPIAGGIPIDTGVWQASELVDDGGTMPKQDVGWHSDIAVKSDGTIGIAHYNNSLQDMMYSEKASGSLNWTTVTVKSEADTGLYCDLEFNPTTGYPCIAFHHAGAQTDGDEALVYAEYNGTTWELTDVDTNGDTGVFPSLEFDPADDYPAIAYWNSTAHDVRYAKFNGTSWDNTLAVNGNEDGFGMSGSFTSLEFNPVTGYPGISFMKGLPAISMIPQLAAAYASYDGSIWTHEVADGGSQAPDLMFAGWESNLTISDDGRPYIIHYDIAADIVAGFPADVWVADKGATDWGSGSVGEYNPNADELQRQTDIEWYGGTFHYVYAHASSGGVAYGAGYGSGSTIDGSIGSLPSLDIDGSGNLHVSYYDSANQELKYATSSNGADWDTEVACSMSGGNRDVGAMASLGYHPTSDYPMMSYYDATQTALKFADKQTGNWRKEIVANDGYDGTDSALDVDSSGTAYIGYFSLNDAADGGAVKVALGSYGSWSFEEVGSYTIGIDDEAFGQYATMALNNGVPSLVYQNGTNRTLDFAEGIGGGSYDVNTIDSVGIPQVSSLQFNPTNLLPGVAYQRSLSEDLCYASRSGGGAWTVETVDTNSGVGYHPSLCYSTVDGTPWISYYDSTLGRLKAVYYDSVGTNWEFVTIAAPDGSADYGLFSSMTWHPQHNRPAVAFYDSDAGKLWYVFIGSPSAPQAAVEVAGGVNLEGAHCSLRFNPDTMQPGIAYQDVTNGDLRYVERHAE
ncbi:fibronectin type III domain-containing protein [bacterium]|nr:fibronectin type III domain-containing protein [bacterium]